MAIRSICQGTGDTDCHTNAAALVRNDKAVDSSFFGSQIIKNSLSPFSNGAEQVIILLWNFYRELNIYGT